MEINCSLCNKNYPNQRSYLNHRRRFHEIYVIDKDRKKDETNNCYVCKYCDKEYKHFQSRWQHEKKCKVENEKKQQDILTLQKENELLKNELIENKDEIIKLQKKLLSCKRLDNKTFKAVNKVLMERSFMNSNNNTADSHNNNNNNNTYQIFALGNEELVNVLTMQQKQQIMNSRLGSIEKIVEITHCGELNQFKNIIITNLKDNYAYRYDSEKGYFITVTKNDLLDDVITNRIMDIEAIYDELQSAKKIDPKTKKLIQDFLDKMENKDAFYDNETKYENFRSYKIDRVKILLYNNQDKITKDIALLISSDKNEELDNTMT